MKSRFFVVLCFAFGLVRGYAQEKAEPVSFSLESAQAYALENSYEITDAQYNVSAAKARVGETRAMGLPQISADVSYQNFLNLATSLLPAQIFDKDAEPGKMIAVQFGTSQNATAGLQVNQLVFNGSYIVALRSSAAYTQMSELSLQKTKSQVKASVRQAYVAVLVSDASIHVLDSMLITTQSSLKHIEAMYKAGFIEETDAAQVRLLVSSLTTQLNSAKLQADIARKMLQYQMGIPSTGKF
jgi:outer membrane protein TolC